MKIGHFKCDSAELKGVMPSKYTFIPICLVIKRITLKVSDYIYLRILLIYMRSQIIGMLR